MPRRWRWALLPVLLVFLVISHAKALPDVTLEGFAMDSYYRVTASLAQKDETDLLSWVSGELSRLEEAYDLYEPDSMLNRYSAGQSRGDEELAYLLKIADEFRDLSAGAYSVHIAPLSRLWKEATNQGKPPAKPQVQEALSQAQIGPNLDFGSLLKGYTADRVYERLRDSGVKKGLVDIGGTIRALGQPSLFRKEWRIAVRNPDGGQPLGSLTLAPGQAVATSGDYERGFTYQELRYHHLVDPRGGYPVRRYRSVTVVTEEALRADILSTLLFVAGPSVIATVEELTPLKAVFLDNTGKIEVYGSLPVEWSENRKR